MHVEKYKWLYRKVHRSALKTKLAAQQAIASVLHLKSLSDNVGNLAA